MSFPATPNKVWLQRIAVGAVAVLGMLFAPTIALALLPTSTPGFPKSLGAGANYLGPPAFADLNGDQRNEIVIGARRLSSPTGEFVFLANFEWGERKDPWLLLRAFNDTFRADEPVRLLCKISNRDPLIRLKSEIRNLGLKAGGGKISYLLNLDFPHSQLPMLYRSADCFLAVSRGEGWDMPLMEAMACGLPAIASDWSSHTEFVNDTIAYRLRVAGTIPAVAKCPYYAGFRWAQADEGHLRTLLRHVFEHPDEARAKGAAAAREMAAK